MLRRIVGRRPGAADRPAPEGRRRYRRWWPLLLVPAAAIPVTTVVLLDEPPCDRPDGEVSLGPAGEELRVATYNIHHGVGPSGELDLAEVIATLRELDADVVGLQEVDRHFGERSDFADQPELLAEALGMHVAFAADVVRETPGRPTRGEYGNAVLSRYPIQEVDQHVLPSPPGVEQRSALAAVVDVDGQPVHVYSTHLAAFSEDVRVTQAAALQQLVEDRGGQHVVLGDLNAEPDEPPVELLDAGLDDAWAAAGRADPGCTFPAPDLDARIDYVLVGEQTPVVGADVLWSDASGHLPVVADLRLPAGG